MTAGELRKTAQLWLDEETPSLEVPLSPGWEVVYHQAYDVHPDGSVCDDDCPGGDRSESLTAALLVLAHPESGDLIGLSWEPIADLKCGFCITLSHDDDSGTPVEKHFTQDPIEAVNVAINFMSLKR
ncbi:hypothetical protein [Alcanivorax sp.]|uniref:hypothetical protein n=1 Tax=Alcanivorax sp. TaxID=1872427 RepID=UPI00260DA26B|nr:hypothetical protein [Alcanivorax sp.]